MSIDVCISAAKYLFLANYFKIAVLYYLLRINRISCFDPGVQTAEQRADLFISVMQHEERRTGAVRSVRYSR